MHASHADWLEMVAKKLDCYWEGADTGAVKALSISMTQNVVSGWLCFRERCSPCHATPNSLTLTLNLFLGPGFIGLPAQPAWRRYKYLRQRSWPQAERRVTH